MDVMLRTPCRTSGRGEPFPTRHEQVEQDRTPALLPHHANWRGTPLATFETIVDRIGNTRTAAGLRVRAALDTREYPTGVTVTKSQMEAVALEPDEFHGEWNYELAPRRS